MMGGIGGSGWAGVGMSGMAAGQSMAMGEAMQKIQNAQMLHGMKMQLEMSIMQMIKALVEALAKCIKAAGEGVKNLA